MNIATKIVAGGVAAAAFGTTLGLSEGKKSDKSDGLTTPELTEAGVMAGVGAVMGGLIGGVMYDYTRLSLGVGTSRGLLGGIAATGGGMAVALGASLLADGWTN